MEMHRLLAKANRIQDLFSSLGYEPIEFPKIAVVGPQSAGKSSVLESLVGKSFLPRGTGLVTRCPLVLQLHHTPYGSSRREGIYHYEEWGTFLHSGDRIFELEEICAEIEAQTSRLAGSNKGIVTTPITLKVFSPNVVNLTLVDLPGITKIPTGDQPADIEKQIERLIFDYIRNPLTIILAVVPANTDMANSESLKLAKEVDPNGERTLAVLTKIDLMDKGTDAKEILRGEVIPVKLGIVGVKNRSQQDIRDNLSVHESLESERRFFAENYKEFDSRTGSIYLARKLSGLLLDHINQCIPNIEARVREQREDCARRLEAYGEYPTDRAAALMRILTNFGHRFRSLSDEGCADLRNVVLSGGPKLAEILHSDLEKNMAKSDPCQFYSVNQVLTAIKKSNNLRPPYIVSKVAFEKLVKPLINDLERPALECVRAVKREISNMCQLSLPALAKRFPRLKQALVKVVNEMIDEKAEKAMGMIKDLVTVETGHITYYRIDDMVLKFIATYDDSEDSIPFRGGDPLEVAITIEERKHVIALGRMLHHYYNIVAATMQDTTVKAIVTFLVYAVRDSLAVELLSKLQADASNLFEETAEVAVSRQRTADELKALDEALDIIANLEI